MKLQQNPELELNTQRLVVAHKKRFAELIRNIKGKQQRPAQTMRKAKVRREQKLKPEEDSALQKQG